MLVSAKPNLEQKLNKVLYDAYMTQYNEDPEIGSCNSEAKSELDKAAKKFADEAAGPTADAIYNFVKEIGIIISVPPTVISPITPILPGGPCSGAIPQTNITVS